MNNEKNKKTNLLTEEDARYDRMSWSGYTADCDPTLEEINYDPKKEV